MALSAIQPAAGELAGPLASTGIDRLPRRLSSGGFPVVARNLPARLSKCCHNKPSVNVASWRPTGPACTSNGLASSWSGGLSPIARRRRSSVVIGEQSWRQGALTAASNSSRVDNPRTEWSYGFPVGLPAGERRRLVMVLAAGGNGPSGEDADRTEGEASEVPGSDGTSASTDEEIVKQAVDGARAELKGALASALDQALDRGAVSAEVTSGDSEVSESREEVLGEALAANSEQALNRGAASPEASSGEPETQGRGSRSPDEDRWQSAEGASYVSRAESARLQAESRQEGQEQWGTETARSSQNGSEGRELLLDERLWNPNQGPNFATEELGGGALLSPKDRSAQGEGAEQEEGRKLPKTGFVVDDLEGGDVEVVQGRVTSGPAILTQKPRRSQKRLLLRMFQTLERGAKVALTDPLGAVALLWLFLKYQTQRVLDWTNTGVWYGRILKLAAVVLVSLPLLRQLSILSTYPLEYALILLKSIVTGEILANLGFAAQVAVIYYPISFSVLAAILGLVGTRQLAVARETNKISRPLAPQLMQLVGFAWYLIMVPGLKVHKTAIGWVGFMTAFYVSFFIKSAVARFVGYTVQRTEGNPQWEGAIAEPREIDPEWRIMPRTATRIVFGASVLLLHYLVMLESGQLTKLFFNALPVWAKLIHTIGALWLLTFCYYVMTHSSDFIRDYFEQYVVPKEIVQDGLYRYVRHPIYASYGLLFVAYAIAMRAPVSGVLLGAISFWYYNIRVDIEEAKLVGRFGQDYVDYINQVPYRFWLGVY